MSFIILLKDTYKRVPYTDKTKIFFKLKYILRSLFWVDNIIVVCIVAFYITNIVIS